MKFIKNLFKKKRKQIWITREGKRIPIYKLDDQHLINIIRFLNRKYLNIGYDMCRFASILQGEMALIQIEQYSDEGPLAICPLYDELLDEAMERGLGNESEIIKGF